MGPSGRSAGHWQHGLEGDYGTQSPPHSLLLPGHEVSCLVYHALSVISIWHHPHPLRQEIRVWPADRAGGRDLSVTEI